MKRTEENIRLIKKRVRDYLGYCLIYNAVGGDTSYCDPSGKEDALYYPDESDFKLFEIIVHESEIDEEEYEYYGEAEDIEVTIRFPKDFAIWLDYPGDKQLNLTILNDLPVGEYNND